MKKIATVLLTVMALAGFQGNALASEDKNSIQFYKDNFAEMLKTEAKCRNNPEIIETDMCVNVRKAANEINKKLGMKPEYPEVEDEHSK